MKKVLRIVNSRYGRWEWWLEQNTLCSRLGWLMMECGVGARGFAEKFYDWKPGEKK